MGNVYIYAQLPASAPDGADTQSECEQLAMQHQELEASELEVERRTRALNLNAVRDAEIGSAAPSSQRSLPLKRGSLRGINVTSTVTTKTVKPLPACPRVEQAKTGQAQDLKDMMQHMIKSSLTDFGVIPEADPPTVTVYYSGKGLPSSYRFI